MSQLKDEVVTAMVHADSAWVSPDYICNTIQCPPDVVQDCLADLEYDGVILCGEMNGELAVSLTAGAGNHRQSPATQFTPEIDYPTITESVGTVSIIPTDDNKIQRVIDEYSLPYPTVLLGVGCVLWDNVKHDICPACGNQELKPYAICLFCDRWGMDKYLANQPHATIKTFIYEQRPARMVDIPHRFRKLHEDKSFC